MWTPSLQQVIAVCREADPSWQPAWERDIPQAFAQLLDELMSRLTMLSPEQRAQVRTARIVTYQLLVPAAQRAYLQSLRETLALWPQKGEGDD